MKHDFKPSILTASDLIRGDVIYFGSDHSWHREFASAQLFEDIDAANAALALAETQPDRIVGAYLTSVSCEGGEKRPDHYREQFRAKGPSNYRHGKQEYRNVSL